MWKKKFEKKKFLDLISRIIYDICSSIFWWFQFTTYFHCSIRLRFIFDEIFAKKIFLKISSRHESQFYFFSISWGHKLRKKKYCYVCAWRSRINHFYFIVKTSFLRFMKQMIYTTNFCSKVHMLHSSSCRKCTIRKFTNFIIVSKIVWP